MTPPRPNLAPGAYKFTVKSAAEAVTLIREQLGPSARVLSVRSVEATGLKKLFTGPRLEVIAQVDAPTPDMSALNTVSLEPALPPTTAERPGAPGRTPPTTPRTCFGCWPKSAPNTRRRSS